MFQLVKTTLLAVMDTTYTSNTDFGNAICAGLKTIKSPATPASPTVFDEQCKTGVYKSNKLTCCNRHYTDIS
jgi:hypothetical protein